ncbi:NlpC/P60 family protein [Corynebacterium pacaense]|uniref:NlpC/P60 family protein n=1 Tax=Corynebacterium pacaense TaxID=1816684 RepID=UPI0009BA0E27|nr:NlpC/P60 family protein [Corynebacterium pacaense]
MSKLRRLNALTVSALVFGIGVSPSLAGSQEVVSRVDGLIAEMEQVSQATSAQNEEVKAIEIDIESREDSLDQIRSEIDRSRESADAATAAAAGYRSEINRIAQAKYRGTVLDPISVAVSAENPQNAIDRMSYMATLSKSTSDVVEGLNEQTRRAADAFGEANRTKAQADFQISQLRDRLADLDEQKAELDRRTEEIRSRVDALSPEERQAWVAKNGPLDVNLGDLLGASGEASGAVQAALGKIGSPYGWGAIGPDTFDCSGLIYWAFQQQGKTLPRTSQAQMAGGTPVGRDQLQPGDVIGYYPGATHVGLYIGDGKIVHASDYGIPVQVVSVDSAPFYGARRY